ncbi:hypothetical protein [Paraburkholderia caballeronis]|uniref:hypothetical protein n=1 Tax=Paraburkholderia caballeronis TaxID=416943 RepID=UPI001064C640|nr:hypothetical protein [Paraburkholderia caballeronis]
MTKPPRATIIFYDEDTEQWRMCTVFRREVQAIIDREIARSGGMTIPPDAPDHGSLPIGDDDARQLGAMAIFMQAGVHTELRNRLRMTTAEPISWIRPDRPRTD